MVSRSSRNSRSLPPRPDFLELLQHHLGERNERRERVVEIVRDATREHAERVHALRGRDALLHAALVERGLLHELAVQHHVFDRELELLAQHLVRAGARLRLEHRDAEQVRLRHERQHVKRAPLAGETVHGRKELVDRKAIHRGLAGLSVEQAEKRLEHAVAVGGPQREEGALHDFGQLVRERRLQRLPIERRRKALAALERIPIRALDDQAAARPGFVRDPRRSCSARRARVPRAPARRRSSRRSKVTTA